jgi:hypothetical protein
MSDLGDTFKAWREEKQEKRASNLASSLELLKARGHQFTVLSEHHFRIGDFDFWPSTGKYLNRTTKRFGRGVLGLLAKLEAQP